MKVVIYSACEPCSIQFQKIYYKLYYNLDFGSPSYSRQHIVSANKIVSNYLLKQLIQTVITVIKFKKAFSNVNILTLRDQPCRIVDLKLPNDVQ